MKHIDQAINDITREEGEYSYIWDIRYCPICGAGYPQWGDLCPDCEITHEKCVKCLEYKEINIECECKNQ